MIRIIPLILNSWSLNLSLTREDITSVPVWIKIHDVPIAAFSEDGLSMIATKLGRHIMLGAYTSLMCMESWGRTSFARALIEITSNQELKDNLVVAIPRINGTGHTMESIRVEYEWKPPRCEVCKIFGDITKQCPKSIKPVRVEDDMEGFTTVACKGGKGKNNDRTNPKLVDGIRLNKSKPNFYYRPVQKQKQKDTKDPTTDSVNIFELKNSYDALRNMDFVCGNSGPNELNTGDTSSSKKVNELQSNEEEVEDVFDETATFMKPLDSSCKNQKGASTPVEPVSDPWCLMGDFNSALNLEDHAFGTSLIDISMREFKECVEDIEVADVNKLGLQFTWNQKPKGSHGVLKKIDHIMANLEFHDDFIGANALFQPYRISDHSPAILKIPTRSKFHPKPFKFSNLLVLNENFKSTVSCAWDMAVDGYDMFRVVKKLKALKKPLWNILKEKGNLHEKVKHLRFELDEIQRALDRDPSNIYLHEEEAAYLNAFNDALIEEERFLKQRAKIEWLRVGDSNSAYFHKCVKSRASRSQIDRVVDMNGYCYDNANIHEAFISHFTNFLGQSATVTNLNVQDLFSNRLSSNQAEYMARQVSNEEIKEAIFSMGDDKSPGPDGYTATFFKGAWDIVGVDVSKAIKEFFMSGKLLKEVNHTISALIPKVPSPTRVNDYRLISCCNVLFKCISKIISNRIKDSLTDLVNINQSAFVLGRRISDNILLTQELMHNYHLDRAPPRCAFKVDIQKAYDTVNWNFLRQILTGFGFHTQMVAWIMECVSSTSFSVNLNGSLYGFFKGKRGLRQGDPLSPYLFTLVMEILSLILKRKLAILNVFPFEEGTLPVKYLGVPLVSSRLAYKDCKELVEKVQNRINNWKNKFLSFVGRLQLIQSVIASMHVYWSSVFILPSRIMSYIKQLMRSFLWCNGEMRRGKAKVAWEDICLPKDEGGLGIRRLDHFNVALISSHVWSILTRKESLWVKWIHTHKLRVVIFGIILSEHGLIIGQCIALLFNLLLYVIYMQPVSPCKQQWLMLFLKMHGRGLWNGKIGKRGIRQGDPLSPYLFTLVMEILSLILKRKVRNSEEFIFHHHCSSLEIINLCFADDFFIFSHGDINSARVIMDALDEFKNVLGLVPSLPKSTAYFCNVLNHTKLVILNVLPFEEGTLPVKYLGVPLVSSRLAYRDCKELVEKSVIASMHVYWSSVFILPSRIMLDIEQLMRSFLWCNGEMRRGKAKVAWEDICLPKDEGGLGIRRLDHFNVALISSHVWSILTRKESLWVKWIHTHKLRGRNFWDYPFRGNMTWGWRKILQICPIIRKFIWYKIGNGSSISTWFDNWSMHSPVIQSITPRDIHAAGFSMQTTVADVVSQNAWTWPLEWANRYPLIFAMTVPSLNEDNDQVVWKSRLDIIKPFSVGTVWDDIRHHGNIMAWIYVVWFGHCIPRHAFHLWLVIQRKLKTQDNLRQWDVTPSTNLNLTRAQLLYMPCSLDQIIYWLTPIAKKKPAQGVIAKLVFAASTYFIWQERNGRLFKNKKRSTEQIAEVIWSTWLGMEDSSYWHPEKLDKPLGTRQRLLWAVPSIPDISGGRSVYQGVPLGRRSHFCPVAGKVETEEGKDCGFDSNKDEVVPKIDDVSLVDGVFDGAFGGDGDEDFVIGEGVVVPSSSLVKSTKSCLGGMMVSLIFLEGLEEEA
ncbi:uncharacterized protein Tco_1182992 [Tanacetum coccineum]